MFKVILLAVFTTVDCSWVLQSTHTNIVPKVTEDVTLQCRDNEADDTALVMAELTRIRILKQTKAGTRESFAEITASSNPNISLSQTMSSEVAATGKLGTPRDSFLAIMWTTASEDTVGMYYCEVDGFGGAIRTDVHVSTKMFNITGTVPNTSDLVAIIFHMKKQIKSQIEDMTERFNSEIENNFLEVRYWPSGNYTLLSPVSGCPDTPYTKFIKGFAKLTTETNKKPYHTFSNPNHLHSDVFELCGTRNVLHFRFCTNLVPNGQGIFWPKGSYCIHSQTQTSCPSGFERSYFFAYLESLTGYTGVKETIVDSVCFEKTRFAIVYCCRSDGDPDVPILLPTSKPFYLYRHKGKCQKVRNMHVSQEWMHLDTDDTTTDFSRGATPDLTLNDVKVEMCYYIKGN